MTDCLVYEPVEPSGGGLAGISGQLDTISSTLDQILAQEQAAAQTKDGSVIAVCALPLADPPSQFLVQVVYDEAAQTWTYQRTNGTAVVEGVDFALCPAAQDYELVTTCTEAIATATGYTTGDRLDKTVLYRVGAGGVTYVEQVWVNISSGAVLSAAPAPANIRSCTSSQFDVVQQILCDSNGSFIRSYVYQEGVFTGFSNRDLNGAVYNPVGSVTVCSNANSSLSTFGDRRSFAALTTPSPYSVSVSGARSVTIYNKTAADIQVDGVGFADPWQAFIPGGGTYSESDGLYTGDFEVTFLGSVGGGSPSVIVNYRA